MNLAALLAWFGFCRLLAFFDDGLSLRHGRNRVFKLLKIYTAFWTLGFR